MRILEFRETAALIAAAIRIASVDCYALTRELAD